MTDRAPGIHRGPSPRPPVTGLAAPFDQAAHVGGFDEASAGRVRRDPARDHDVLALVDHDMTRCSVGPRRARCGSPRAARAGIRARRPDTTGPRRALLAPSDDVGGMSFVSGSGGGRGWVKALRELPVGRPARGRSVIAWPAYDATESVARSRPPAAVHALEAPWRRSDVTLVRGRIAPVSLAEVRPPGARELDESEALIAGYIRAAVAEFEAERRSAGR